MGRDEGAVGGGQQDVSEDGDPDPSLKDIMRAIRDLRGTLEPKLDSVTEEVNLLRADFRKMSDKVAEAETGIGSLQSKTKRLEEQVASLTKNQAEIYVRLEDQEGRARRNNVRVVGVPEGMEGQSVDLFIEDLVLKHLQPKRLSNFFSVERAHRALGGKPRPGAPPRTIIARILNYRDRDAILQAARLKGDLHIENATIRLFPDFTLRVQRQRRSFDGVKRALRDQGVKYMMLFPARLKILDEGKAYFFEKPEEANDWLEGWRAVGRRGRQQRPESHHQSAEDESENWRAPGGRRADQRTDK